MNLLRYKIELQVQEAIRAANNFIQALRLGLSIDIGRRLIDGFMAIKQGIQGAITEGIRFNATLESSTIGIAAVLRQFSGDKYKSFGEAMRGASSAIEYLKQRAKETPASFEDLVLSFQALAGPLSSAGIEMRKQIDLVVLLSNALSGLGISQQQLVQESRALVTGMIDQNAAAARILGITREQITEARESGRLYEFLTGKLSAFSDAARASASSFSVSASNLKDSLQQAFGAATADLFSDLKGEIQKLTAAVNSSGVRTGLQMVATAIAQIVRLLGSMADIVARNATVFAVLITTFGGLAAAMAALKLGQFVAGLGLSAAAAFRSVTSHLSRRAAIQAETQAINAHTMALAANTAAMQSNAASSGGRAVAANAAASAGAAASVFGAALARLSVWSTIAYMIGQGIAAAIDGWSKSRQSATIERANAAASEIVTLGRRVTTVSTVTERDALVKEVSEKKQAAIARQQELSRKSFKTAFDRAELQNLSSDIASYDRLIAVLNSLTAEQIEQMRQRIEAERQADQAAKERARKERNANANEAQFVASIDRIDEMREKNRWDRLLRSQDTPQKRLQVMREEQSRISRALAAPENDLWRAKSELDADAFAKKAREVEALHARAFELQRMIDSEVSAQRDAEEKRTEDIKARRAQNRKRLFDRWWENASDESKSKWLVAQAAAVRKALANEKDPLKREQLRERMLDLAEKADALKKSKAAEASSIAQRAIEAREGLAKLGQTKIYEDIDISRRFDWMRAVGRGESPDERVAQNTEEMKKYLKIIAESEGITP